MPLPVRRRRRNAPRAAGLRCRPAVDRSRSCPDPEVLAKATTLLLYRSISASSAFSAVQADLDPSVTLKSLDL
jgi:hypothetical protein